MKGNELVWRTLADAALLQERRWKSVEDLAFASGVPASTTNLALDRLSLIGAILKYPRGGFSVTSLDKVLTLLCARRNLIQDTLAMTTVEGARPLMDSSAGPYALGGPDAANVHLGGVHVADFVEHLLYVPHVATATKLPPGGEVRIVAMDKRAARTWSGYSSPAQTYADLFATPGWAASEYRYAIRDKFLREREWDQAPDAT